jgi:hypothetical protein
LDSIIIMVYV